MQQLQSVLIQRSFRLSICNNHHHSVASSTSIATALVSPCSPSTPSSLNSSSLTLSCSSSSISTSPFTTSISTNNKNNQIQMSSSFPIAAKYFVVAAAAVGAAYLTRRYSLQTKQQQRDETDRKFGFSRDEMNKEALVGSVDGYTKHIFVGTGQDTAAKWPDKWENDPVGAMWMNARKAMGSLPASIKEKITAFDGAYGTVLIYPERIKYKLNEFTEEAVAAILDTHLSDNYYHDNTEVKTANTSVQQQQQLQQTPAQKLGLNAETFYEDYIFVCAHNQRDRRCGVCGPPLIEGLKNELHKRGLTKFAFRVHGCSHIGGHKYAGNVLSFIPRSEAEASLPNENPSARKVMGDWYGYVTPDDVVPLLDACLNGKVVMDKWRGSMGVDKDTAKEIAEHWKNQRQDNKKSNKCEDCDCGK